MVQVVETCRQDSAGGYVNSSTLHLLLISYASSNLGYYRTERDAIHANNIGLYTSAPLGQHRSRMLHAGPALAVPV